MTLGLDHLAVIVGDLEAAIAFYGERLRLGDPLRLDVPELRLRLAFFRSAGSVPLELVEFGGKGELSHGDVVIALEVDDLDAELARLRAAGTHVFDQQPTPALPFRRGWITKDDAHGTVIELCPRGRIGALLDTLAAPAA